MLILKRQSGQAIVIGGPAVVRVFCIEGTQFKIGIDAPAATEILRGELATAEQIRAAMPNRRGLTVYRDPPETSRRLESQAVKIRDLTAANETLYHEIVERDWTIEEYRKRFAAMANQIEDLTPECEACGGDPSTLVCGACKGSGKSPSFGLAFFCETCHGTGKPATCGECGKAAGS